MTLYVFVNPSLIECLSDLTALNCSQVLVGFYVNSNMYTRDNTTMYYVLESEYLGQHLIGNLCTLLSTSFGTGL